MWNLYDPHRSVLGKILQREIHTKQLVNEHALIPINNYLQNYIFPDFKKKPIQRYLDIAAGTGVLSAQIADMLRRNGHPATMFTLDLFNNVAESSCHVQANGIRLPFRQHSFDFITMNLGFRYFVGVPKNQHSKIDYSLFEKTAISYGLDKDPILYKQFMSKALFLQDILYRVLKPSGRLMLMISTESATTRLNIWQSSLSTILDCFRAELSPWASIRRFCRIANPTSIAFIHALYQEDVAAKHIENHFFNSDVVTQALLAHFQGRLISVNTSTYLSILEFTALNPAKKTQAPIQDEKINVRDSEYALSI